VKATARSGYLNSGIHQPEIMHDLFRSHTNLSPREDRMDRLEGIRIFVRVVESGSSSAVARELGIGQPAISKQVAALEVQLGAQLLMRTSRSLSLSRGMRNTMPASCPVILKET
jgi:hypothetical protein